jgi:hypothetical protein
VLLIVISVDEGLWFHFSTRILIRTGDLFHSFLEPNLDTSEPNAKFSDWQQRAWAENWSDEDWNNFLNDPFYYRPETWRSNSSHAGEDPYP